MKGTLHRGDDASINPYIDGYILEALCVRIIDESSVTSRCEEHSVLLIPHSSPS